MKTRKTNTLLQEKVKREKYVPSGVNQATNRIE